MISVIIPNYNRKNELLRSINSVLNQTYKNIEIIVVDDCSIFGVEKFLEEEMVNYNLLGIKVIVNEKNIGPSATRNNGVKAAKGEYIAFLDSDDFWEAEKLEKQMAIFGDNPELDLVYSDQFVVADGVQKQSQKKMIKNNFLIYLIKGWTAPNPSTLLFKKCSFEKIGGFDKKLRASEDHDLWFRMALHDFNISYVDESLSNFVQDSSDRISYNIEKRIDGVKNFLKNCKNYMSKKEFQKFQQTSICDVTSPIFTKAVKEKKFLMALKIYVPYLMANRFLYKRLLGKVGLKF